MDQVSAETVALIAAAGAALGALIGAASGGVVEFLLDRAREKRDAKVGARLVRLDLALAASQLKAAEGEGKWWVFYSTSMEGWEAHRTSLAARLDDDDFETVTQSVAELQRFGVQVKQMTPAQGRSFHDLGLSAAVFGRMRENATNAYNALAKLAKQRPVQGLLHD